MGDGRYNELVNGVYKPTNISGGAPSCSWQQIMIKVTQLSVKCVLAFESLGMDNTMNLDSRIIVFYNLIYPDNIWVCC